MAQKGITLYTAASDAPHIAASDDAAIYRAVFGSTSGITDADNRLAATRQSDTAVRIDTGIFSNQGFMLRVDSAITLAVDMGQSGYYRRDLIVAEYVIGGGSVSDTHVLKVIKGTQSASEAGATDPALTQDSLITGSAGNKRQEPLFRLRITGTSLGVDIERIAPYIGGFYA